MFFYHSNIGKEIVGIDQVIKESFQDPTDKKKYFVAVRVKHKKTFTKPVSLNSIKKHPYLKELSLVKQRRLTVMKKNNKRWKKINKINNIGK